MVLANAIDFHALAVEGETFLCIELEGANTEGRFVGIHHLRTVQHFRHHLVECRALNAPKDRVGESEVSLEGRYRLALFVFVVGLSQCGLAFSHFFAEFIEKNGTYLRGFLCAFHLHFHCDVGTLHVVVQLGCHIGAPLRNVCWIGFQ